MILELKSLLKNFGILYSEELGINLKSKKKEEIFKWFLASILFGTRISETIAKNTYKTLEKYRLLTPQKILAAGWDFLVNPIMREGGYVRYDGKTSDQLLRNCKTLLKKYKDLSKLHEEAKDSKDLKNKLLEFYGVGPTTANIFLRELRGIWPKAKPELSKFANLAAKNLGIKNIEACWKKNKVKGYEFRNFQVALLRLGKNYCNKNKCALCPLKKWCKA